MITGSNHSFIKVQVDSQLLPISLTTNHLIFAKCSGPAEMMAHKNTKAFVTEFVGAGFWVLQMELSCKYVSTGILPYLCVAILESYQANLIKNMISETAEPLL